MAKLHERVVIVCNGDDYNDRKITDACNSADYIIAVDGGLHVLDSLSIIPDLIIGDMDSVDKELLNRYKEVKIEIFPVNKDYTDSELAIKNAISLKPDEIFIFSAIGSYIDHSFANVLNLLRNYNDEAQIKIITKNSEIFPVKKEKVIEGASGRRFSFFPIGNVKNLEINGFKYTFKDKNNLTPLDYSVSNVIIDEAARIRLEDGMLICFLFDEGYK